ncbi:hypothetical protein F5887DRAFT_671342 [Amanita rubescens]|nr:hypothetical protein F5887DRAFT_671342 [Amanita rubescens]
MNDLPSSVATGNITDAPRPFDSSAKRADVILYSRDSKKFYVLKILLCLASPVFETMFSSWKGQGGDEDKSDVEMPIIPVEEDSTTLYNLLLLIYPYNQKPSSAIDICFRMGKAARKYDMDYVDKKIRDLVTVSDTLGKEPLRVFAIAMLLGWEDVMKAAAYATLGVPLRSLGWCQELELLSAGDHHKLLQWRFKCHDAVISWLYKQEGPFPGLRLSKTADAFRKLAAATLRDELTTRGCPRSSALINDTTKATLLQKTPGGSTFYDILKEFAEGIDQASSEVRNYPKSRGRRQCSDLYP